MPAPVKDNLPICTCQGCNSDRAKYGLAVAQSGICKAPDADFLAPLVSVAGACMSGGISAWAGRWLRGDNACGAQVNVFNIEGHIDVYRAAVLAWLLQGNGGIEPLMPLAEKLMAIERQGSAGAKGGN